MIFGLDGKICDKFPRAESGCRGAKTVIVSFKAVLNILCHTNVGLVGSGSAADKIDEVHAVSRPLVVLLTMPSYALRRVRLVLRRAPSFALRPKIVTGRRPSVAQAPQGAERRMAEREGFEPSVPV